MRKLLARVVAWLVPARAWLEREIDATNRVLLGLDDDEEP